MYQCIYINQILNISSSADDPIASPGPEDILDLTKATDNITLEYIDQIHHSPQEHNFKMLGQIVSS